MKGKTLAVAAVGVVTLGVTAFVLLQLPIWPWSRPAPGAPAQPAAVDTSGAWSAVTAGWTQDATGTFVPNTAVLTPSDIARLH